MTLLISDLAKSFGTRTLFANVSVALEPGKFLGVSGRNGSGKSTFLRVVGGLEPATRGTVWLEERDRAVDRQDALYFPQRHYTFPLTGAEFWTTIRRSIGGVTPSSQDVTQWADRAPKAIREWLQRPLNLLSLGQQRAVLFYVFASQDRAIMLFDEPFAGLSANSIKVLAGLLPLLKDRYVIIVDHRSATLETVCDRTFVL